MARPSVALVKPSPVSRCPPMNRQIESMEGAQQFDGIVGQSEPIRALVNMILKVAPYSFAVLVRGESGTGKELIARAIQRNSTRGKAPFIPINCGAIPESLMEAHLFGYQKGAFTGASSDKPGLFEAANGGTIFLDEIGEMPPPMQVKLLRALQEKEIVRVGGTKPIKVDVRLIAATNRDLKTMMSRRRFREDLYYRISTLEIEVPALRERREDIPVLALHFVEKFRQQVGFTSSISIEPAALELLKNHDWPGNVRELENFINRLLVLGGESVIPAESVLRVLGAATTEPESAQLELRVGTLGRLLLPTSILELTECETLMAYLRRVKREVVRTAIAQFPRKAGAAKRLGLAKDTMRKLASGINRLLVLDGEPAIPAGSESTAVGTMRPLLDCEQPEPRGCIEDRLLLYPSVLDLLERETMTAHLRRVTSDLLQAVIALLLDSDAPAESLSLARATIEKLERVIDRLMNLGGGSIISAASTLLGTTGAQTRPHQLERRGGSEDRLRLPESILELADCETMTAYLTRVKGVVIQTAIARFQNRAAAAERLGLAEDTMRKQVRRLRRTQTVTR